MKARIAQDEARNLCQICQDSLFTGAADQKVFALGVCSEVFHTDCILQWIKTCIEDQNFPIRCPDQRCKQPLPLPDLRELLTPEQMDRCQKFEWKKIRDQNPHMLECPSEGCDYLFFKELDDRLYH